MSIFRIRNHALALTVGCGLLLSGGLPAHGAPAPLNELERDGYLQWLHSLETAVAARVEADLPEANTLFPFDVTAWDLDDPRPYRHLSISKAVTELEARWNSRAAGNIPSTLMALANARNYVNLSEYDSALVWYGVAADLDSAGSFRREIARETLATAISANDSLATATGMTNTLGTGDLRGRQEEIILAYRWLLTERDREALDHLLAKTEAHAEIKTPRVRYWHAFALDWRGRRAEAIAELRVLVAGGGLSHGLTEGQRSWVLKALADGYFGLGDYAMARDLYRVLADSRIAGLRIWGKYQTAGLDFIANRYLSAATGFQQVCEDERMGSWQDHACRMQELAQELQSIKAEGEPYGVARFYSR